MNGSQKTQDQ